MSGVAEPKNVRREFVEAAGLVPTLICRATEPLLLFPMPRAARFVQTDVMNQERGICAKYVWVV